MVETLGHYKILDRIGAGGMGEVYRARDMRHGRTVAIKVLTADIADDPDRRERFLREAREAAALSHPNIATLYEVGDDQGVLFLVFEFVPGEPLGTVIAGRPLNTRRAIDFAVQIADALADVHAEGIVHGDIKPANIVITPKDKAKLLDVGLAAWTAGGAERERAAHGDTAPAAAAGTTLGTIAYLSPEQALGEKVDHHTDIFSLGIVLFEMLTGRLPFSGPTPAAVPLQIVQATAPPPSSVNPSLPAEIDVIVGRALAKSLPNRYETAATMAAELRSVAAILDVRSEVIEAAGAPAMASAPRERSGLGWLAALLVIAAIAAAAWYERAPLQRLWRRTLGPVPPAVIAVVPFSTDPGQTFFADGLAEDVIARLGQTPGLTVVGRSATRASRGRAPHDVARELGARAVLTGSLRQSGDSVDVSMELIDPQDDTDIWTGHYAREVKDIFAMQAQIAEDVAAALRVKLQPTGSSARAASRLVDRRGYELYLRGREAAAERRLPDAVALYEQAIAADAGLSEAFAGIAEALIGQASAVAVPDQATRARARTAGARAYELDPDLPEANVAMGLSADALSDALKYLRRAVELDPSHADADRLIGDQIADFDRDQAIGFYRKSLTLDPRLDISRIDLAGALSLAGRSDEARKELQAVSRTGVAAPLIDSMNALIDLHAGQYAEAAAALSALPDVRSMPSPWAALAAAFRLASRPDDALSEATALQRRFPQDCEARAVLAALLFERKEAAAAHRLADGPVAMAGLESPLPSDIRCALHAAAAVQNPAAAAALLDKVQADESRLRGFAAGTHGAPGSAWISARTYPWSLIASQPPVVAARQRLDTAYAREREISRTVLAGLP